MAARRGQTPRASLRPVPSAKPLTDSLLFSYSVHMAFSFKSILLLVGHVKFLNLNFSILARYAWVAGLLQVQISIPVSCASCLRIRLLHLAHSSIPL
jgi:hypothetical protein